MVRKVSKPLVALLILLSLGLVGLFLLIQNEKRRTTPLDSPILIEQPAVNSVYKPGVTSVTFREGTTKKEATAMLKKLGLEPDEPASFFLDPKKLAYRIKVPVGEETNIGRFLDFPIVKYASAVVTIPPDLN